MDFRNSAQRGPRNLCPLLRMISLRRQGPGERIDLRPRWVSGIGQGRLSPGWEIPSAETGCSVQATPFPPPCTCGCRLTTWRQSRCNVVERLCAASFMDTTLMCKTYDEAFMHQTITRGGRATYILLSRLGSRGLALRFFEVPPSRGLLGKGRAVFVFKLV